MLDLKNFSGRSDFGFGQLDLPLDLIGMGSPRLLQTRGLVQLSQVSD